LRNRLVRGPNNGDTERTQDRDNTLIIFTSDNWAGQASAPPLRGNKTPVSRAACVSRDYALAGRIPAGTTCDQILGNIDMLPTFAKLAGVRLDASRVIDGKDITSLMFDDAPTDTARHAPLFQRRGGLAGRHSARQLETCFSRKPKAVRLQTWGPVGPHCTTSR